MCLGESRVHVRVELLRCRLLGETKVIEAFYRTVVFWMGFKSVLWEKLSSKWISVILDWYSGLSTPTFILPLLVGWIYDALITRIFSEKILIVHT